MKHVTIVVPEGKVNLSSVAGTYEILKRANGRWQEIGHNPKMELHVAGFGKEVKLNDGLFSIHPEDIKRIKRTDLVIIPATVYTKELFEDNTALLSWIIQQYKNGAEIA